MNQSSRPGEDRGSAHDRSARERDLLRELHELTGRPRSGEPSIRMTESRPPGSDPDEPPPRSRREEGR
jgi:hypothetical protein